MHYCSKYHEDWSNTKNWLHGPHASCPLYYISTCARSVKFCVVIQYIYIYIYTLINVKKTLEFAYDFSFMFSLNHYFSLTAAIYHCQFGISARFA